MLILKVLKNVIGSKGMINKSYLLCKWNIKNLIIR